MNVASRRHRGLWLAALLAVTSGASAQHDPHIGYVYPAGARVGAELEATIGGQYLDGVHGVMISGEGVQGMVIDYAKPMSRQQQAALRRRRLELRKRREAERQAGMKAARPESAEASSLINVFTRDLGGPDLEALLEDERRAAEKKQLNPQIAETVTVSIKVSRDAKPGVRELRLKTPSGLSNPLFFHVGQWEEYCEREPNDTKAQADIPPWMPAIINGQIMPGDVDRFRFRAAKGTPLVAAVSARSLIPYLADAVPGWFQATLTLYDAEGNQLAYVDDFRFHPDPVIYYSVPRTGEYVLEIKDAIYRGREDFVYRIALGGLPFVTRVFPLGGRVGTTTTVEVEGWNLQPGTLTLGGRGRGPGIMPVSLLKGTRLTNRVHFCLDTLPERLETEPNNDLSSAQPVGPPVIVNGRIDRPGDWDVFRFEGRAGDELVARVQARCLGSPVDSLLKLTDARGKLLAANDDHPDQSLGLTTHHADSELSVKLPKDGTYLFHLGDTQEKGGPAYAYRLRIGPPRPDFELRVAPSAVNAPAGSTVPIMVFALRKDGFSGEIALGLKDRAPGFALAGGWVPSGQDKVRLTLTVPRAARKEPVRLRLEGRARIGGKEVRRTAVPAEDMMQAFIYRHLVPTEDWLISVTAGGPRGAPLKLVGDEPVKIPAGGTARVLVAAAVGAPAKEIRVTLSDPPEGISVKDVASDSGGLAILLSVEKGKAEPGLKGNLIAEAFRETVLKDRDGKPTGRNRRTALGMFPAIPFEIVAAGDAPPGAP